MLEKKNLEKSKKKPLKRSERKKKGRKTLFALSFLFVFVMSAYFYLLKSPLTEYGIVSVSPLPLSEKVKAKTDELITKKFAGLFPYSSFITPTLAPFENELKHSVTEVETLKVSRNIFKKELTVEYTLRKPVLRLASGSLIDEHNKVYVDDRSFVLPLLEVEKPLSDEDLRKIIFLKETVETAISNIEKVRVDSLRDVTFVFANEVHTEFVFSLNQDEKVVWSKAVSAFFDKSGASKEASFLNSATSVDLRFGDKIYYRVIEGHAGKVSSSSSATSTYGE
jgi:hypothetical protein